MFTGLFINFGNRSRNNFDAKFRFSSAPVYGSSRESVLPASTTLKPVRTARCNASRTRWGEMGPDKRRSLLLLGPRRDVDISGVSSSVQLSDTYDYPFMCLRGRRSRMRRVSVRLKYMRDKARPFGVVGRLRPNASTAKVRLDSTIFLMPRTWGLSFFLLEVTVQSEQDALQTCDGLPQTLDTRWHRIHWHSLLQAR